MIKLSLRNLRVVFVAAAMVAPSSALAGALGTSSTGAFEVSIDAFLPFGAGHRGGPVRRGRPRFARYTRRGFHDPGALTVSRPTRKGR